MTCRREQCLPSREPCRSLPSEPCWAEPAAAGQWIYGERIVVKDSPRGENGLSIRPLIALQLATFAELSAA